MTPANMLAVLGKIVPTPAATLEHFAQPLVLVMEEFSIDEGLELAAFLAQCAHESQGFTRTSENLYYTSADRVLDMWPTRFRSKDEITPYLRNPQGLANRVYAGRFGNGDEGSGDGWRYRGHGLLHVTWKENLQACLRDLYGDATLDPDRLEEPTGAARSAGWFWWKKRCASPATRGAFAAVTKIINPSAAGGRERAALYLRARTALGV